MQTWEIEFEDGTTWRGEALSGRDAMLFAGLWKMGATYGVFGDVAITSCREVCIEAE